MQKQKFSNNLALARGLFLVLFFLYPISGAQAQREKRVNRSKRILSAVIFVSPNTEENLTLNQALAKLNAKEESGLMKEEKMVACKLGRRFTIQKAIGNWSDGAENSTVVRGRMTKAESRYVGSWLGRFARQKAVLSFHQYPQGKATLYVLTFPLRYDLSKLSSIMDQERVGFRTFVPFHHRVFGYVVDLKHESGPKVTAAVTRLRARTKKLRGNAEFIGDDNRERAQAVFTTEISNYEAAHPRLRRTCPN
jgi:hypothetical protein